MIKKIKNKIANLFCKTSTEELKVEIKIGDTFGISTGKYLGEFFIFIEQVDKDLMFLSIPKMKVRSVPVSKFRYGIQNKVLEFVERLPKQERSLCKLQYNQSKLDENKPNN